MAIKQSQKSKVKSQKFCSGIAIIEVLIVASILGVALASLLGFAVFSLKSTKFTLDTLKANNLAREAIEATRNFRDNTSWSVNGLGSLLLDTAYFPKKGESEPPVWKLVEGEEIIDGFTRKVIFQKVFRDSNGNITEQGGTEDPQTRKVKAIVSWEDKEIEITTYLTNWQ